MRGLVSRSLWPAIVALVLAGCGEEHYGGDVAVPDSRVDQTGADFTVSDRPRLDGQGPDAWAPDSQTDQGLADGPQPDRGPLDLPGPDLPGPDQAAPDLAALDQTPPDHAAPTDQAAPPDQPALDQPWPDQMSPDLPGPDVTLLDLVSVDLLVPAPDLPDPDFAGMDQTIPDLVAADSAPAVPDQTAPDWTIPDQSVTPDQGAVVPGTWVTLSAGTFLMGSPSTESCRVIDEIQHGVTLTHGFEIMTTEVTQDQFYAVLGYKPSYFSSCGGTCPVEQVSWYEAAAYANALSLQAGKAACYACKGSGKSVTCSEATAYAGAKVYTCPGYRLPTEAEWEYAYRAGTGTAYYSGANSSTYCGDCTNKEMSLDSIGWYCANSIGTTHPVGLKTANAWGLYDMAGNVWEWCHDPYGTYPSSSVTDPVGTTSSNRMWRGSSWTLQPSYARAAARITSNPSTRSINLGFRLLRSIAP